MKRGTGWLIAGIVLCGWAAGIAIVALLSPNPLYAVGGVLPLIPGVIWIRHGLALGKEPATSAVPRK